MPESHDSRPTVDVDHQQPEWHDNRAEQWAEIRERCPVVFNKHYGGFWMATDYESVSAVMRDAEGYAHKYDPEGTSGIKLVGVAGIPRHNDVPKMGLTEDDGPRHNELRRILNPHFAPRIIEPERAAMRQVAHWFLDQKIGSGAMDLVLDYANPVPAVITLRRMGLPVASWETWSHTIHGLLAYPEGSAEQKAAAQAVGALKQEMLDTCLQRRDNPTDDVTSVVANAQVEGELLSDDDIRSVMWTLTVGGLNTTTGLVSKALCYLSEHHDHRKQLIENPELIRSGVEEFLRFWPIAQMHTRTVMNDAELGGCQLARGDVLLLNGLAANHDPAVFDRADEIMLDREDNRHLAFGLGPHRCIGSNVGRIMAQEMILEILQRTPDFVIDTERVEEFKGWPNLAGVLTAPMTFTPGARVGAPALF